VTSSRREGSQSILCTSCYKLLLLKTLYFSNDEDGDIGKKKSIQNYPGVDNFFVTETTPMAKERHEKVFRLWEFVKQKKKNKINKKKPIKRALPPSSGGPLKREESKRVIDILNLLDCTLAP
jgi:hypothetical protein